ncbi:hypothetical protein Tcan_04982 [Toxocara canis]|uniref:Uncharacterized protein n=1 Tax=Toxocara canis TaxID=6265 RepID=A0A0B2W243_TOXCA|nr:hypothetical protein Tcan_04982 [Toxocara canis]
MKAERGGSIEATRILLGIRVRTEGPWAAWSNDLRKVVTSTYCVFDLSELSEEGESSTTSESKYFSTFLMLSELSEEGESSTTSESKYFSTFLMRIPPLLRSKKVRALAVINVLLTITNALLFITVVVFCMLFIAAKVEVNSIRPADLPCLYEWGPWSACSSKCRTSSSSALPFTFRRITKVFNSTGTKYAPCPTGLVKGFEQFAPCNTHM